MEFQFEIENYTETETNPDLEFVIDYLKQMNRTFNSFCTLSFDNGSFVQCAGDKNKMIIELRKYNKSQFKHYVLGKTNQKTSDESVEYSGGMIELKSNEVLNENDALSIFKSFVDSMEIPKEYVLRDITNMF